MNAAVAGDGRAIVLRAALSEQSELREELRSKKGDTKGTEAHIRELTRRLGEETR